MEINSIDDYLKEESNLNSSPIKKTFVNLVIFNPKRRSEVLFIMKTGIKTKNLGGRQIFCLPGDLMEETDPSYFETVKRILESLGETSFISIDDIIPLDEKIMINEDNEKIRSLFFMLSNVDGPFKNILNDPNIVHIGFKDLDTVKRLVKVENDKYAIQFLVMDILKAIPIFSSFATEIKEEKNKASSTEEENKKLPAFFQKTESNFHTNENVPLEKDVKPKTTISLASIVDRDTKMILNI